MPRRNRNKMSHKNPKPNDKAWERRMMNNLRRDSASKDNPEDGSEFEPDLVDESGTCGDDRPT